VPVIVSNILKMRLELSVKYSVENPKKVIQNKWQISAEYSAENNQKVF